VGQIQSWEAIVAIYPCQWYLPQLNQYHVTSREIEGTELIVNLQKGTEQPQEIHPFTNAQTENSNWHEKQRNRKLPVCQTQSLQAQELPVRGHCCHTPLPMVSASAKSISCNFKVQNW
jgi:hypothetical protein